MLEKDPDRRYLTAAEALADLRALYGPVTGTGTRTGMTGGMTGTTSVPAMEVPAPRPRKGIWAALVVAVVLGASLAGYLALRPGPARLTTGLLNARYVRLTDLEGKETFPSISPDGTFFAYAKSIGAISNIFLQRVGGGNPINLTKDPQVDDTQPAYSPDGQQIAFRSEREGGGIFVMGSTGESVRRVADFGYNPAWSPNGTEIVCATQKVENPIEHSGAASKLYRVNIASGDRMLIAEGDAVQPSWSPHGTRIAYWGIPAGKAQRVLWTIPAKGGTPVPVPIDATLNWSPAWSPDGRFLNFSSDLSGLLNIWRVPIDETSGKVLGPAEPLNTPSTSSGLLSFSRDGHRMAYASDESRSNLESFQLDGEGGVASAASRRQITRGARYVHFANVSPDGRWISYYAATPREEIFVVHPDGSEAREIVKDDFKNRNPVWSGDGQRILFYSNRSGKYEAWSIHPDGSHLEQLTAVPREPVYNPITSPDSKVLACNLGTGGAALFDLTLPIGRRLPRLLPKLPGGGDFTVTSWSKDGARLAGVDSRTGKIALYSFSSRTFKVLEVHGTYAIWLHDDRRLLYLDNGIAFIVDIVTGSAHEVAKPPARAVFKIASIGPDDKALYVVDATDEGDIWIRYD
jgi:Tol biopolymer transport system component